LRERWLSKANVFEARNNEHTARIRKAGIGVTG
jgi:hypothetical protein